MKHGQMTKLDYDYVDRKIKEIQMELDNGYESDALMIRIDNTMKSFKTNQQNNETFQ